MSHLQIKRLRIEQLRQFRAPFELADFAPGLNIFTGPNEAGKSTLVRALRAAFFERHRSTAVDDLKPWGDSAASPSIELDFVFDGTPFQLSKSFLARKRCDLTVGAKALEGPEAEDFLAELFGFGFAGKGASKEEHWGVPGLLWVQQGAGQELDVSHARDHLHTALSQQAGGTVSSLTSSRGDDLLAHFTAQRAVLLTPSTGKPRAAYAEAIAAVQLLDQQLAHIDQAIATYRSQVDELAQLQQQHRQDEADPPEQALGLQLAQAQAQQSAIEALSSQLTADQQALQQLLGTRALLQAQLDALAAQEAEAAARTQALERVSAQLAAAAGSQQAAGHQREQAAQRDAQARATLAAARLAAQRQDQAAQLQQAQAQLAKASADLARARQAHAQLAQHQAQAPARLITPAQVDALAQLEMTLKEAAFRKDTVATRIVWNLLPGQRVQVSTGAHTQELQGQAELLVDAPTRVQLPGLGEMSIQPGGEELEALLRAHQTALQAFQAELTRLGLDSLAQARSEVHRCTEHQQALKLAQKALALVAPAGAEALQAAHEREQQRVSQLNAALQALPESTGQAVDLPAAEQECRLAEAALQQAEAAWQQAQLSHARGQAQREQAQAECEAAALVLADPERAARQAATQQALQASQAQEATCQSRMAQTQLQLSRAQPGFVAQDIERLQKSITQIKAQHQQRRERIMLLQNTLQVSGAQGLEEQRATLAGEGERAQRRKVELDRRAQALELLCSKLEAKRQQSLQRLQQPLHERLQHYLALLFPGASLEIKDDLSPGNLLRPRPSGMPDTGAVSALSFGSREQIGLICRFAYADLLAQAGRPTLLILDDALVHSDEQRLAQMKRVIYDVSQRHQVLLFTCHPAAWRDAGVGMRGIGVVGA